MGRYTDNYCAVCFSELLRPQNTCGAADCLAVWRNWSSAKRLERKNLAHMPPSERALILAQGPSDFELAEREQAREILEQQIAASQSQQQHDPRPSFIRDMLSPDNFKIKPEGGDST